MWAPPQKKKYLNRRSSASWVDWRKFELMSSNIFSKYENLNFWYEKCHFQKSVTSKSNWLICQKSVTLVGSYWSGRNFIAKHVQYKPILIGWSWFLCRSTGSLMHVRSTPFSSKSEFCSCISGYFPCTCAFVHVTLVTWKTSIFQLIQIREVLAFPRVLFHLTAKHL